MKEYHIIVTDERGAFPLLTFKTRQAAADFITEVKQNGGDVSSWSIKETNIII